MSIKPSLFLLKGFFVSFLLVQISPISLAESSLRVSADELQKVMLQSEVIIVDARSFEDYEIGHIPGAVNFPEALTYDNIGINGRILTPNKMQQLSRDRGLSTDKTIVVYDNGEMFPAARLFWTFEVYGFTNVKVLDQGFTKWQEQQKPVSQEPIKPKASNYVPVINHQRIATKLTTQIASRSPNQVIIDARSIDDYQGRKSSAKRFGFIPTASSIPAGQNLITHGKSSALLPAEKLKALYSDISKDSKVVIYCSIGFVSATNYLVLRELGYNVANYDASWKEWGNDMNLPIEQWQAP